MKRLFQILWAGFQRFGRILGAINTTILLSLSFYLLLLPLSLPRKLRRKPRKPSWKARPPLPTDHFQKQY